MAGGTHLTVDTCIGTDLIPGDIIDPQALPQSSGRYGSETDHRFFILNGSFTSFEKSADGWQRSRRLPPTGEPTRSRPGIAASLPPRPARKGSCRKGAVFHGDTTSRSRPLPARSSHTC